MRTINQAISAAWFRAGPKTVIKRIVPRRMPKWMRDDMNYIKWARSNPLLSESQKIEAVRWTMAGILQRVRFEGYGEPLAMELVRQINNSAQ